MNQIITFLCRSIHLLELAFFPTMWIQYNMHIECGLYTVIDCNVHVCVPYGYDARFRGTCTLHSITLTTYTLCPQMCICHSAKWKVFQLGIGEIRMYTNMAFGGANRLP